jgi:hypothetical protein
VPARSNICDFHYGRIALDDLTEPDDRCVALLGIACTEKLPAVVVLIVRHMQDWLAAKDDRPQSDDCTIGRLIECIAIAMGLMSLVLSMPAVIFCRSMSPLDFPGLSREVRVPASGLGYTVAMVQKPGFDFYDSYLEICRSDGKITRLMVDADDSKWWGLCAKTQGTRTDFVNSSGEVVGSVDFADGTLSGSIDRRVYKLDELDFDRAWSNGG